MSGKYVFKVVLVVAAMLVSITVIMNYFNLQREITVQDKQTERVLAVEEEVTVRALQVEDKETERVEAIQGAKTNRTEERSKFWNKLVPWNDEPTDAAVYDGTNLGADR